MSLRRWLSGNISSFSVVAVKHHDLKSAFGRKGLFWFMVSEGKSVMAGDAWQPTAETGS